MEIFFENQTAVVLGEMLAFVALGWWYGKFMETTEMLMLTIISVGVTAVLLFPNFSFFFTVWSLLFFALGFGIFFTVGFYTINRYINKHNPYP